MNCLIKGINTQGWVNAITNTGTSPSFTWQSGTTYTVQITEAFSINQPVIVVQSNSGSPPLPPAQPGGYGWDFASIARALTEAPVPLVPIRLHMFFGYDNMRVPADVTISGNPFYFIIPSTSMLESNATITLAVVSQ